MVFTWDPLFGSGRGGAMVFTQQRAGVAHHCVLCCGAVQRGEPGNIAVHQQLLTFTQRYAVDLLAEVLNDKALEPELARSRWLCASCYAQLELLDKYEQDRRVLEKRSSALRGELLTAFARRRPRPPPAPQPEQGAETGAGTGTEANDGDAAEVASNGADSDAETSYVEVKVESIAAVPWSEDVTNGTTDGDDADDADEPADRSEPDEDEDPLGDVTPAMERTGSPTPCIDLDDSPSGADPLADEPPLDATILTDVTEGTGTAVTGVNVTKLQSAVRRSLRTGTKKGYATSARAAPARRPAAAKRPASGDPDPSPPPAKVAISSASAIPGSRAGLKTLLPKLTATPPVSTAEPAASEGGAPAATDAPPPPPPLLLQSTDGQLFVVPAGGAPAAPVTLLRLPDGRLVMSGGTAAPAPAQPQTPGDRPRGPGSAADSSATSTLKNLLLGQASVAAASSRVVVSSTTPTTSSGPILESVLRPGKPATPQPAKSTASKGASKTAPQQPQQPPQQQQQQQPASSRLGLRLAAEPCPLCSLVFGSRELVDRHLRSHTMVCSSCDLLFASRLGLFEHRQVCARAQEAPPMPAVPEQVPDRGLNCSLCGALVSQMVLMNEHASREHGLLYRCPKCDCTTGVLREYLHHVREAHGLDSPHPCNLCQTSYSKRETQRRHFESKHSAPLDRPMVKDRTIDGVRLKTAREEMEEVQNALVIVKEEEDVDV